MIRAPFRPGRLGGSVRTRGSASRSPANLLVERVIEECYDGGDVDELNVMTDPPWLQRWNMKHRAYWDVRLYPRRPDALVLVLGARRAGQELMRTPAVHGTMDRLRALKSATVPLR